MLEQDYLMRMIIGLAAAMRRALERNRGVATDDAASRYQLEQAIGDAAEMDVDVLFSLEPESVATMLWLGNQNDSVAEYIVHAMMMDADFLDEDGYASQAALRRRQANAVADTFGFSYDPARLEALLNPTGAKDEAERAELEAQYQDFK